MTGVNYLVEINSRSAYKPIIATPVDWISRLYNMYYVDLQKPKRRPEDDITYWQKWSGWYVTPDTTRIEEYVMDWMERTYDFDEVLTTPFLFYVDDKISRLYFNLPKHPWLYETWETQLTKTDGFLHTVKDPLNPSDTYITDDYLRVILDKPSDTRKLSDPIHGVDLFLSFSIKLTNTDGAFDLIDTELYFNGPLRLYKTWKYKPLYADFVMIRTGIVDNVSIDGKGVTFSCAEKFRTLEQSACKTITRDEWVINTTEAEGKSLPIVFGTQEVALVKIIGNELARFRPVKKENNVYVPAYVDYTSIAGVYAVIEEEGVSKNISLDYEIEGGDIIAYNTAETVSYIKSVYEISPVHTKAELPGPSELIPNLNYLCRVINDTAEPDNNGVWELAAGAAAWALIPDTFDYVDETHNRVFSVETKAELPDPSTLNPDVNYMCRVTDDKVEDEDGKVTSRPENNGVWHLKAGAAAWALPPPQPWQGETMLVDIKIHVELEKKADMPVEFLAAEYITAVAGVYDKDGKALVYSRNGLVITAPREANYAVVTGYTNNRLGEIAVQLISTKGGVEYSNTFWDTAETDAYKNTSPRLNIAIKSGTVRSAVNEVLKSDMVFLIQKNNARFTLRTWGKEYGVFTVEKWLLTQQPSKNWKDAQKYWFSSCVVKYAKNDRTGEFGNQIFLNDNENNVREKYNRMKTSEFETNLTAAADARSLAGRLSERFNFLKETISIGIGKDTSGINPLDAILITVAENERVYSHTKRWIVKEIDPAQDKMTLEEA